MSTAALDEVGLLAARVRSAQAELRAAVVRAQDAGASVVDVAAAADVTRQTVYRWLRQETGAPSGLADTRATLDRALAVLAGIIGETNAPTLWARLNADGIEPKVRGIEIGVKSLPAGIMQQLTDEERMVVTAGIDAAWEARRVRKRTGRWPDHVRLGQDEHTRPRRDPDDE